MLFFIKNNIMAENNLSDKDALAKLKEIVDKIDVGTVCSFPQDSDYPHGVPMSRQEVDEEGNIWYICSAESETFTNLSQDSRVSLFYADPGNYTFLSINGDASLSRDQERIAINNLKNNQKRDIKICHIIMNQ